MKSVSLSCILVLSLSLPSYADDSASIRPSKLLLSTFSSQCSQVVTNDVGISLGTLQALYGIVEDLKNDKACLGATQLANTIASYGSVYEDFQIQNSGSEDKLMLDKKIALYATLVSNPNLTPIQLDFLNQQIVQSQSDLVNIKAGLTRFQSFSGKEARRANQVIKELNVFLSNLSQDQNNTCTKKHGAQITSLVSNTLLVTAAFVAPGAALALAAGAVVVSTVGTYVENFKYNRTLNQANDIEMPIALRCVSQVITDQYCAADGIKNLIQDREKGSSTPEARYEGIALLSYQLSTLSKWLDEVYAGSEITSQGDLINREKPILQAEFLKKVKRYLETFGTIKRKSFENLSDQGELSTAIAKSIQGLAYIMDAPSLNPKPKSMFSNEGSDFENPIFISNSQPLMPFNLWSMGAVKILPSCDGVPCTLDDYLRKQGISLELKNWTVALNNAATILQATVDRVNAERAKTVSVDAYTIIVNAERELKGEVNPYLGLQKVIANADRIIIFLSKLGCEAATSDCEGQNNRYYPQISNILKTKTITKDVLRLIDEGTIPRSIPPEFLPRECKAHAADKEDRDSDILEKKSFEITSCISIILKLAERGTDVYFSKIRSMVSYEMEARLANGKLGEGLEDLIDSSKDDLLQTILNSYGPTNKLLTVGDVKVGLETAQASSKQTLTVFFDFFKKDIVDALKNNKIPPGPKNDFCFRILPYLDEDNQSMMKEAFQFCEKAEKRTYKDAPVLLFSDFVQKSTSSGILKKVKYSFKDKIDERARFCKYNDYHDAALLYDEQIKQRSRGFHSNKK